MVGGNGEQQQPPSTAEKGGPSRRPTITPPPRASMDTLFNGGGGPFVFSPGPMTLVSSFFADNNDECKSFSQLLAGAMSPVDHNRYSGEGGGGGGAFEHNNNTQLSSPLFMVPPGFSSVGLLDSPTFLFSPPQGNFGLTHQQALAQVTSQAVKAHSNVQIQDEHSSSVSLSPAVTSSATQQLMLLLTPDSGAANTEPLDYSHSEQRLQSSSVNGDKPSDDGYNWRKYGQKQVKGSEFPRSYYKCTHPNCPVKKKVERSFEGHVTAIIYKGEHNHQRPHPNKLTKDSLSSNVQGNHDATYKFQSRSLNGLEEGTISYSMSKMDPESSQATAERVSGTSDSEEVGDHETEVDERNDEPNPKRRNTEVNLPDQASSHRTVTEPRIIVQTTSEVDLLDDGYRWRKYGQKVVKGNPYPRSYYKCTTPGCGVRKHVERASTDPKAVITTYEGKHNHDVPAAKTNSHTMANNTSSQLKRQNAVPQKHSRGVGGNEEQPIARLRLKEEQIT
ncbi:hypothetical protein Lal_00007400 [Lupinus albus]|uniref:Putative transcription factor WRKY family n=1 Tax=Lupinus albus TaxID=3870 RepID=A0A6A5MKH0_LUPAL|nr:putative transcription factor WRKY family [Lupinus albus]KAF1874786.1 hypothetical protein Lal_00007400 [Lupinus albus]